MNNSFVTRREAIQGISLVSAGLFFGKANLATAAPEANLVETKVISHEPDSYCGWPTLTRRASGELLVVCSGGRESHVCPFGRVELIRSHDNGDTWTYPEILLDGPIDDRDAGVLETAKGTLLVTTFTSLAYEPQLQKAEKLQAEGSKDAWKLEKLIRWRGVHNRVSDKQRKANLGTWMIRSTDGGVTWSGRYDCLVNSPHGPIQLSDGRLLHAGKQLWLPGEKNLICVSDDDGQTWKQLAEVPTRSGDKAVDYHELHAVEASDGTLIVQIRNHNPKDASETLQIESKDGGKTWTEPHSIGVWGLPSHLLKLRDGRLLMSYGYRRPPFGNQARISTNNGQSWSEPLTISADGAGSDLGYPSTVELADGTMLTVWYEKLKGSDRAVLRQAKWKLPS